MKDEKKREGKVRRENSSLKRRELSIFTPLYFKQQVITCEISHLFLIITARLWLLLWLAQ